MEDSSTTLHFEINLAVTKRNNNPTEVKDNHMLLSRLTCNKQHSGRKEKYSFAKPNVLNYSQKMIKGANQGHVHYVLQLLDPVISKISRNICTPVRTKDALQESLYEWRRPEFLFRAYMNEEDLNEGICLWSRDKCPWSTIWIPLNDCMDGNPSFEDYCMCNKVFYFYHCLDTQDIKTWSF